MKTRISKGCPRCCDGVGCTQTWEMRTLAHGAWKGRVWVLHCKTMNRIHKDILGKDNYEKHDNIR